MILTTFSLPPALIPSKKKQRKTNKKPPTPVIICKAWLSFAKAVSDFFP